MLAGLAPLTPGYAQYVAAPYVIPPETATLLGIDTTGERTCVGYNAWTPSLKLLCHIKSTMDDRPFKSSHSIVSDFLFYLF